MMSGLRKNQTGIAQITLIAGAAVVIVVVLVIAIFSSGGKKNGGTNGQNTNASNTTASSGPTQSFTSSDKIFSLNYPKDWKVETQNNQNNFCNGIPCIAQTTFSSGSAKIMVLEAPVYDTAKVWFNQTMAPASTASKNTSAASINGYSAYTDTITTSDFTAVHTAIATTNYVVDIYFQYITNTSGATQDLSSYLPQYKQMVQSLNFHSS